MLCRHGEEDEIVTLMGLVQALAMSVIHGGEKDNILCVCAGKHKIVFLVREPLILCSVSQTCASLHQSSLHLMYVYYQIISILTASSVTNIFSRHNNYDLRRLLTGSERFLDNLVYDMDHEPCFFLSAVSCLSLEPSVRDIIIHTIVQHCKIKVTQICIYLDTTLKLYSVNCIGHICVCEGSSFVLID